ncbi:MAG TPA: RidA family protein [archaeon]|nr:RidA family protein [archaeon]
MKSINSPSAPTPIGPYSQAILAGDFLFVSGHVGNEAQSGKIVEGGIAAQTKQVMENLGAILKDAGLGFDDVIKCEIYLKDIADFKVVNGIYGSFFPNAHKPARQTMQVAALPLGALIEISCIAHFKK